MALTFLFLLLLADAAVETFWSGSPVRWWVVGISVVYFGIGVLFWRATPSLRNRVRWSARASATFFVLLGVLALTAWLPGGLVDGVLMLRQPTSVVFCAVSAVAVAFAGVVLVRAARRVPWWGRVAIVALVAYCVVAFLVGIVENTPYPALFQGESLWRRGPRSIQGAVVGALIALPLAALVQAVRAVQAQRRRDGRPWALKQTLALLLSIAMAAPNVTVSRVHQMDRTPISARDFARRAGQSYRALAAVTPAEYQPAPTSTRELVLRLERLLPMLQAAQEELRPDSGDIKSLMNRVGRDPNRLFEWVRDKTYLVPYRGVLKGAIGVAVDRFGNSLDRALLLHALLSAAGQEVRLARGSLSQDRLNAVVEAMRRRDSNLQRQPFLVERSVQPFTAADAKRYQIPPDRVESASQRVQRFGKAVLEELQQRVDQQARMLEEAIGRRATRAEHPSATSDVEPLQDHWWVQWRRQSQWIDLDPTLPQAAPAFTLTAVDGTVSPDDIPDDENHELRLRVIIERFAGGRLEEVPVLSKTLRPHRLFGQHIVLAHVPVKWPKRTDPELWRSNSMKHLRTMVLQQNEWQPLVSVGSDTTAGLIFTDSGETYERASAPVLGGSARNLGFSIGDLLSGRNRGDREGVKASILTAEWIVYEIRSPGRAPRIVRREVFDLLHPGVRGSNQVTALSTDESDRLSRALALMSETEILPFVAHLSPQFVQSTVARYLIENAPVMSKALRLIDADDLAGLQQLGERMRPLPGELYAFGMLRAALARPAGAVYLPEPNVVAFHRYVRLDSAGQIVGGRALDIVANTVSVVTTNESIDPFNLRLRQGVADTTAEAVLMGDSQGTGNPSEVTVGSGGGRAHLVTAGELNSPLLSGNIPASVRAKIQADLAAGSIVLLPNVAANLVDVRAATWWSVDPATGTTVGRGWRGWGQTTKEYFLFIASSAWAMWTGFWCITSGYAELNGGKAPAAKLGLCILGMAICGVGLMIGLIAILWGLEVYTMAGFLMMWNYNSVAGWLWLGGGILGGCGFINDLGGNIDDINDTFAPQKN